MKKMRRLIPAIAMLLVSAVMLSTASFAWFTMNTKATASGMQLQARADSSLVIDDAPLQYNTGAATVDFNTNVNKLTPITYDEDTVNGWAIPNSYSTVNTTTGSAAGLVSAGLTDAKFGTYFIEKSIYIGSAGNTIEDASITVTLTAPVHDSGDAYKAYAAAIYVVENTEANETVWAPDGTVALDKEPTQIVWADPNTTAQRFKVTLTEKFDIPSVVGVGETDTTATTGLKVIIRFFVDGNLWSTGTEKIPVATGEYSYTTAAGGTYYENVPYYVVDTAATDDAPATYKPAVATPDMVSGTSTVPTGWFTRAPITEQQNYCFIRSAAVPTAASQLEISFSTDGT